MARVDVIIPCYRYAHYLGDAVRSVLSQSHRDVRILIIDDASPDDTAAVAAALAAGDSRISVARHAENRGHIATYNEGLAWAEGDYVVLLSADDMLAPGALRRAVAVLEARPDVALVYGDCVELRSGGRLPDLSDDPAADRGWVLCPGRSFIANACRIAHNVVPTPTAVGRNAVQKQIGGYRPELPHSGDTEMWLRYAAKGAVARLADVQAIKREHGANMAHSYSESLLPDLRQRKAAFERFFAEFGDCLAEAPCLRETANRVLAEKAFWYAAAKLIEGRPQLCAELFRFAVDLQPELRTRPPVGRLFQTDRLAEKIGQTMRRLVVR